MGAEDLDLKAIDSSQRKKEKKKSKKREASSDIDLGTSTNFVDAENSVIDAKNQELKATNDSGQKEERKKKKNKKKRERSYGLDVVTSGEKVDTEAAHELHVDYDLNEPTMGEKLASLNLDDDVDTKSLENDKFPAKTNLPSADSVHVLLKQALHADDRVLLLDCLYTQDEKVIAKSVSLLNPSDVLKLLDSLISIIQSRGAVLACALPWLRSLLLQHASGIMSQESSLVVLNSLYQLIESRVSTFRSALQLSSCMDYFFVGITDDMTDEMSTITPVIYEDKSESDEDEEGDEDEAEDAIETDQQSEEHLEVDGISDDDGCDFMSE